jgi:hypothetical protein
MAQYIQTDYVKSPLISVGHVMETALTAIDFPCETHAKKFVPEMRGFHYSDNLDHGHLGYDGM